MLKIFFRKNMTLNPSRVGDEIFLDRFLLILKYIIEFVCYFVAKFLENIT